MKLTQFIWTYEWTYTTIFEYIICVIWGEMRWYDIWYERWGTMRWGDMIWVEVRWLKIDINDWWSWVNGIRRDTGGGYWYWE